MNQCEIFFYQSLKDFVSTRFNRFVNNSYEGFVTRKNKEFEFPAIV